MKRKLMLLTFISLQLGVLTLTCQNNNISKAEETTPDRPTIETSNVAYDLKILYSKENEDYTKFDLSRLMPNGDLYTSNYDDFAFYTVKPFETDIYFYCYNYDKENHDILSLDLRISKSVTIDEETKEFVEEYENYNARYINSYGYQNRFHKFVIEDFYKKNEDTRMYIKWVSLHYRDYEIDRGETYETDEYNLYNNINYEIGLRLNDDGDFVAQAFSDNYVKVTDKKIGIELRGDKFINQQTRQASNVFRNKQLKEYNENYFIDPKEWGIGAYYTAYEYHYCFFDIDKNLGDLVSVQNDYQLMTYRTSQQSTNTLGYPIYNPGKTYVSVNPYDYGFAEKYNIKTDDESKKLKVLDVVSCFNSITSDYVIKNNGDGGQFLFWKFKKEYSIPAILDCRDLSKIEDKLFKSFIEEHRVKEDGTTWTFAYMIGSPTYRYVDRAWWSYFSLKSTSICNEVKQNLITKLCFREENKLVTYNALDIPKDSEFIHITPFPSITLLDVVFEKVIGVFDFIKNDLFFGLKVIIALLIFVFIIWLLTKIINFVKSIKS